ncbi:transcriptional regulator FtrA [Rhodanobacter sp. ANJX3]|uniref:transcriptional regulator FtrA n=1 Tax=Rhodanobacter sp. ANJX3 TaxID=2723083 RepID=UPI00210662C6|nr:transcriptional regulator FtrA [Rhodanobacter sp. ANJX3]
MWRSLQQLAYMTLTDQISPTTRRTVKPAGRLVVALVYDGLCSFEFGCAAEVFGLPRPEFGPDWYRFSACAVDPGPMRALGGLRVTVDGGLGLLARADTIVIPGWKGIDVEPPPKLIRALRAAHARGARLVSICSGVFVLAATGLLDGRCATTHWRYTEKLAARYPQIVINPNVLYVDQEKILTSAGSAAGLDLCLHIVRRDFGAKIANQVARRLVISPHRDGGQIQFIERPVSRYEAGNRLPSLLDRLVKQLDQQITVSEMAALVSMSERSFLRRFNETTGTSPADWLTLARVDRAKELLETTSLPVEAVAVQCGFGSAITLRHHFRNKIGLSPLAYRRRFALSQRPAV